MKKSELKQLIKEEIDKALNEGISSFFKKYYLIVYNVTNYKASEKDWKQGRYDNKFISKDYEYTIVANNENDAKDKFSKIWYDKTSGFEPQPKLNIKSVVYEKTPDLSKNKINIF